MEMSAARDRSSFAGRRFLLVVAMAVAACSGALRAGDAGPAGIGGAGGTSPDAATSTGGTAVDAAPATDHHAFDASPCGVGASSALPPTGACGTEGTVQNGRTCHDSYSYSDWTVICCAGQWREVPPLVPDAGQLTCPPPLRPGDRFPCGPDGLTCVAGETYCQESANDNVPGPPSFTCEKLCAAGDCSCFCGNLETCSFLAPNNVCSDDYCYCALTRDSQSVPQAGGIHTTCRYGRQPTMDCRATGETCATAAEKKYHCEGVGPPDPNACVVVGLDAVCDAVANDYCCVL
jgi:hypothetical protein